MKVFNNISIVLSFVGGFFVQYLGGWDKYLYALICIIIIDYISGLIKAMYNKKLSSAIGRKGILKKVMIFVVVATTVVVESVLENNIPIREITIVFYLSNEGISILENASEFLPIPQRIKDLFLQLRNENNEGGVKQNA